MSSSAGSRKRRLEGHRNSLSSLLRLAAAVRPAFQIVRYTDYYRKVGIVTVVCIPLSVMRFHVLNAFLGTDPVTCPRWEFSARAEVTQA
jgi:hypothetical protein